MKIINVTLWFLGFVIAVCTIDSIIFQFQHPELTQTQVLLKRWENVAVVTPTVVMFLYLWKLKSKMKSSN